MPKKEKPDSDAVILFNKADKSGLESLPIPVQQALSRYQTREVAGIAPTWDPKENGAFILGEVTAYRIAGQFNTPVIVLDTPQGPYSVWLSADLKLKLGDENPIGKKLIIQYQGILTKLENPSLKNDMKVYNVIEVMGPSE